MRLFVAIPLPEQTTAEITQAVAVIRQTVHAHDLRWSSPESWHITLQFLGSVTAQQYPCVLDQLRSVHSQPLRIAADRIGTFARAGILYAGIKSCPQLLELQKSITAATRSCGFALEDRPYLPHITSARTHARTRRLSAIAENTMGPNLFHSFTAQGFALYETVAGPPSRYEIREEFL